MRSLLRLRWTKLPLLSTRHRLKTYYASTGAYGCAPEYAREAGRSGQPVRK